MVTMSSAPLECVNDLYGSVGFVERLKSNVLGFDGECLAPFRHVFDRFRHELPLGSLTFDLRDASILGIRYLLDRSEMSGKFVLVLPEFRTVGTLLLVIFSIGYWLLSEMHVSDYSFKGISISTTIGFLFSIILYFLVLPIHKFSTRKIILANLLLASAFLAPYLIFDTLGIENTAVRFTICAPFVLYGFKILEAVFGFVPHGAQTSFRMYSQYFSFAAEILFDDQSSEPILATKTDLTDGVKNVISSALRMSVLCSFLSHYMYKPFGHSNAGHFFGNVGIEQYLDLRHLGNCFAMALFFQQGLALGDAVTGSSVQFFTGYKVLRSMRNPMLEAESPSDFWGRRWNILVHSVMKRGVYKPTRKYASSSLLASLLVFVASGLFHEWLVHAVLIYRRHPLLSGEVFIGSNTAFFIWNYIVIMIERLLSRKKALKSFGEFLPQPFVTMIIILTSLPVVHWFGNPYMNGGFFADYEQCIAMIRKAN